KLKHFLNLKQAYTAYKKFVNQSMPRGSKTKTIKYKIENNIPLGKDSSKKSRWGWISAKIQSILNIDSSAERKTRSALRFVDLLLSENLVTLESLVATKASPDFFKRMSASIKLKFYRRLKRDENAKFEVGDSDDSELESENDCEGNENVIYQHEFCRLHDAEFHIIPDGQQKNYPLTIDFENLPSRVKDMFPELLNIAVGKTKSLFRDLAIDAYNTLGIGAKKPTALMGRFLNFIPGYYGTKGMSVIQSTLSALITSNELTYEMTKPQSPDEYLNEVLVPEAAIRLIAQDRQIGLDEAKKVMEDSVEFGMYVHDIELEDLET
ncbi:43268_t:CDS:2, partial [Gigaspora margarita]